MRFTKNLIRALVPVGSPIAAGELERLAGEAQTRLTARLAVAAAPLTIRLHASLTGSARPPGSRGG